MAWAASRAAAALAAAAVAYPLAMLALRADWAAARASPLLGAAVVNTLLISCASAALSLLVGGGAGMLSARASFPGRGLLRLTMLSPFLMSQSVMALAWIVLAEGTAGLLNRPLRALGLPPFEAMSLPGIVFVTTLLTLPLTFFAVESLAAGLDPELEEAALVGGASRAQALRRVVLPMLAPGLAASALLCFLLSNAMFSVQGILGAPARVWTVSSLIYLELGAYPSRLGSAALLAAGLLAAGLLVLAGQRRLLARAEYHSAAGRRPSARTELSGAGRATAGAAAGAFFLVVVVLPYGALLLRALAPYGVQLREPGLLRGWSLDGLRAMLADEACRRALLNSGLLAAAASAIAVTLSFVLAWLSARDRGPLARLIPAVCVSPFAFSGMVLGLAFVAAYAGTSLYATLWLVLLAYVVRELAVAFGLVQAAVAQVEPELEEAALVCGASGPQAARRVTAPLIAPSLVGAAALTFLAAFREVESSVLLSGPGRETFGYQIFNGFQQGAWRETSALALAGAALCAACAGGAFVLTRRLKTILALTLLLAVPASAGSALEKAAAAEGRLVWYAVPLPLNDKIKREFEKRHPAVKVAMVKAGGTQLIQRFELEQENGAPESADVVSSGLTEAFPDLRKKGRLAGLERLDGWAKRPAWSRDPGGAYYYYAAFKVGLMTNENLIKPGEGPRSFKALADPRWRKQAALFDTTAGFAVPLYRFIIEDRKLGWEWLESLRANEPLLMANAAQVDEAVVSGRRAVAIVRDTEFAGAKAKGGPVAFRLADEGHMLHLMPAAISDKAAHPNAARLFLTWLMSDEGRKALAGEAGVVEGDEKALRKTGAWWLDAEKIDPEETRRFVEKLGAVLHRP